jgi:hypothetical protein
MFSPSHNFTLFTFLNFFLLPLFCCHAHKTYHLILLWASWIVHLTSHLYLSLLSSLLFRFSKQLLYEFLIFDFIALAIFGRSTNYDIQYKVFSFLLLLPMHNTDIYPTGLILSRDQSSRFTVINKITSWYKNLKENPVLIKSTRERLQ